ncbi:MAG: DUF3426 domain-containing protein [Desulfovibrionaceae bacterium]
MIVQCPNCQAKFRLPDDKIGSGGAKVRCGKCRHVFPVSPPEPEPESVAGLTDFDFPDDMTAPPETAGAALAAPPKDVPAAAQSASKPSSVEPFDAPAEETPEDDGPVRPGFSLSDVADIPLPGSRPSNERRRRLFVIGAALVVILLALVAAIHFLDLWPGKKAATAPAEPPAASAPAKPESPASAPAAPEAAAPEAGKPVAPAAGGTPAAETPAKPEDAAKVKEIMLQNVRQYYVSNEKAGQLFVIEGKAVNNFKTPKEMIKLQATLFDDKGASLASQDALAGNTVSLFQLQVMTRDELKAALSSQVGVLTNNTNIQTGGETPFMVVFFDPPEAVKEFGVKVVDAKDPPRQ